MEGDQISISSYNRDVILVPRDIVGAVLDVPNLPVRCLGYVDCYGMG